MAGTDLYALPAADTFVVIYGGEVVGELDCVRGTVALALTAGDTAHGADLSYFPARSRIRAGDIDLCFDGNTPYYLTRTSRDARAAARTVLVVYF